jgi:hypothetical protein
MSFVELFQAHTIIPLKIIRVIANQVQKSSEKNSIRKILYQHVTSQITTFVYFSRYLNSCKYASPEEVYNGKFLAVTTGPKFWGCDDPAILCQWTGIEINNNPFSVPGIYRNEICGTRVSFLIQFPWINYSTAVDISWVQLRR